MSQDMYDPAYPTTDEGMELDNPQPQATEGGEPYDPRYPTMNADEAYDPRYPTMNADEAYDPLYPTVDDAQAVVAPAQAQYDWAGAWRYEELDLTNNRLQQMQHAGKYWHPSERYKYIEPDSLEFHTWDGQPLGTYYRNADRFSRDEPQWGDFWLIDDGHGFDVAAYADQPSANARSVLVPWPHLAQHLYEFCDLTTKERHTFWPYGTTEDNLLQHLVDALNAGGQVMANGAVGQVIYESADVIKTFFPTRAQSPEDVYTADEMEDIGSSLA